MAQNTALNNETICDLSGQPLDRNAALLLKAVDKLLTVGSYYSDDHEQYRTVSEKSCEQIVAAIGADRIMAIEIGAAGMMLKSQVVDPHHRNVRLLHDLLVPLNIARFEISAGLTAADLRQAISALQEHRQNLGNTTGFQEIRIENLPDTVSTASKNVVKNDGEEKCLSLDELFDSDKSGTGASFEDEPLTESEKLAGQFLEIVARILENLQKEGEREDEDGLASHPDSTPENIKALREALERLVEVNPDPADLARLIEHAKRALDLSNDPRSVDLVFSLLKKEVERGADWKYKAQDGSKIKPKKEYRLSLEELGLEVLNLTSAGGPPADPGASSLSSYLGICLHLLGGDPSDALEISLESNLQQAIAHGGITRQDLNLCSAAVAESALKDDQVALDRVLPVFCRPLRKSRPDLLVKFWTRLWEALDPGRRALAWPHLVNDLLLGLKDIPDEVVEGMWRTAGQLDSRVAFAQVSRLECTRALLKKATCSSLMRLPLSPMYPVHLALMKSSLAPLHGPRIHEHLRRNPPNGLTEILMKSLDQYDPANDGFYLSLIKQSGGDSISLDLRGQSARLIAEAVSNLPAGGRDQDWVARAIGWVGKLDPRAALPLSIRVCDEKKYFFFSAWPRSCRQAAEKILAAAGPDADTKGRG